MFLPKNRILTWLLGFSLVVSPAVIAQVYQAPFDKAKWTVTANKRICVLSHEIPSYGTAIFEQKAGEGQAFRLENTMSRARPSQATIHDAPPKWRRDLKSRPKRLATVKVSSSSRPIHLTKMTSYEMLDALSRGREPYIKLENRSQEQDRVVLSATGFKKSYTAYLDCVDNLLEYTFVDLKNTKLFFESASIALTPEGQKKLDAIVEYVIHDEDIRRIDVTGHSDSVGGYLSNRKLANERMWHVKDYMVYRGVSPKLFTLKGYGDRKPLGSNKTVKGREKNRRVEIKLYR